MANGDGQKPRPLPQDRTAGSGLLGRIGQNKVARKYLAPAMTGLGLMSQLNADQGRDRQADTTTSAPSEGPVLLELPTRSYTQREESDEMRERQRQQGMMQTQRAFTAPEGDREAPTMDEEPEAPEVDRPEQPGPEQAEAVQFAAQQQRSRQVQEQQTSVQGQQSIKQRVADLERSAKMVWRVVGGVQGIASIKLVPLLTLTLQSNLQTINHIFHLRFIPEATLPEDMRTGCLNGIVCCLLFASCISFIAPFALITAAMTPGNYWQAFTSIGALFTGLF